MTVPGVGHDDGWQVDGEDLWQARPAAGRCEVVCFSSDHTASFADLTPQRVRTVIEAWADRTAALSALPGVRQVFPFEVDSYRKHCLINGLDDIGLTLEKAAAIDSFETKAAALRPWA